MYETFGLSDNNKTANKKVVFVHTNAHNYNIRWKDLAVFQNNFLDLNNCVREFTMH